MRELERDDWRSKHDRYLATTSFGSLDGLRALSILAVVWHHAGHGFVALPITTRGFLGVDLFFVISGFLIVTLLLRERRRTGEISLGHFYARRSLRIFPAYWAMLLFVGGIALVTHRGAPNPVRDNLPFAALYLSNLVPMRSLLSITWSLSAEEQFYAFVPAMEKYAHRFFGLLLPILYVAVSLPPLGFFAGLPLPDFFRQTTFGPILLGVLLAHLLDSPEGYRQLARVLGGRGASLLALVLVLITCSWPAPDISGWPRLAVQWSLAILVASCVVQERHALFPVLRLAPLRRLGVVSYGIYLYHLIVLHFVEPLATRRGLSAQLPRFTATLVASWLVAEVSFRWFESRFLAQKHRFAPALVPEGVAPASVPAVMGQPSP